MSRNTGAPTACEIHLESVGRAVKDLDAKLSIKLTNQGGLRRSRVAGWRIIFLVDDKAKTLSVVTIERRNVYKRM